MKQLQWLLEGKEISHIRPFLWMKGESQAIIKEELNRIEECGIREICLESRPHPDFCGPGWWQELDFILAEARTRGMKVWILDDDKFPTGHANGGFQKNPDKKKTYLAERHMDLMGPCRGGAVLVENFIQPDGTLLGILAVPKPDGESLAVSGEGGIDLTDRYENGFVYLDLPEGAYRLFVLFTTCAGGGREDYMNLIDADSVQVLIDEVYEAHYAHYGTYFGNTIAGFFSDEPELGNVKGYPFDNTLGQRDQRLPWSRKLEAELRRQWGGEFLPCLVALWYEAGERTFRVRSQYMDQLTLLVRDNFSGHLGRWCEKHGVEYIGHVIEDDNAHTRMGCGIGHYFREMEGQHMAGIDVVHHQVVPGFTEPVHQWIAGDEDGEFFHFGLAKLGSSAAHIQENKRGRALCEIFGNYGWAEGNSLMKWLTNHMLVRGINEFTPHAFSMKDPDWDCPPHFYARGSNPGFACFTWLMKYMNRGAHLLSEGIPVVDAAILYHAEAEWSGGEAMYYQKPGRKLMEKQLDYDVVPKDVLGKGNAVIDHGRLMIDRMQYSCLILPGAGHLDPEVARFAAGAAGEGLKILVVDTLPECDTWGRPLPSQWTAAVGKVPAENTDGQDAALIELVSLEQLGERVAELEELYRSRELLVAEGIPQLRSFMVRQPDGIAVMLFNESVSHKARPRILVRDGNYNTVTVYDAWHNRARTYRVEEACVSLCLDPGEAVFMCFGNQTQMSEEEKGTAPTGCVRQKTFGVPAESRKLSIDWRVSRKRNGESEFFGEKALIKAGEQLPGLNSPGYWPDFTGTYRYEGEFCAQKETGRSYCLRLPEASDSVRVMLNGRDYGFLAGFPARVEITDALEDGSNRLVLEVSTTLVWSRKDGASTHLMVPATGITEEPELEMFDLGREILL